MEKYAKREPKWEPKSIKNATNVGKKGMPKMMPKFDAEKEFKSIPK